MAGRDSAGFQAFAAWSASRGLIPLPASQAQVAAFLEEIEARGGPFASRQVCSDITAAHAELGIPITCPGGYVAAGSDYGRAVAFQGIGYGWYPPADAHQWAGVPLSGGGVRPQLPRLDLAEAEAMLAGLVAVDIEQIRQGAPLPSPLILSGRLRYLRNDPREQWLSLGEVLANGGGDCEDLAAAVAAERTVLGMPSRVRVLHTPGRRVAHAVVEDLRTGQQFDPSISGGMGWNE